MLAKSIRSGRLLAIRHPFCSDSRRWPRYASRDGPVIFPGRGKQAPSCNASFQYAPLPAGQGAGSEDEPRAQDVFMFDKEQGGLWPWLVQVSPARQGLEEARHIL